MRLDNFLRAVGAAVDGDDDFDLIWEWFGGGFLMVFSAGPFPDADFHLEWLREEGGGNVYRGRFEVEGELQEMEGWLCPALNLYYPEAPKELYVQVREVK